MLVPCHDTITSFMIFRHVLELQELKNQVSQCLNFARGGDTFPLGSTSHLEGSSGLQEAYTKACPNSAKNITAACWYHVVVKKLAE